MNNEVSTFMRRWIDENVTADWYRRDDDEVAPRLARKCLSDVVALGLEIIDVVEEIGSLEGAIGKALKESLQLGASVTNNLDREATIK